MLKSIFFGGTFDPVHNGHIEVIKYIKNNFKFKKIFIAPAGNQYMKIVPPIATPIQRYEMCKLAFADNDIELVDYEINKLSPSYTIDTLNYINKNYPDSNISSIVLGSDAFEEINLWKKGSYLLSKYKFIVFSRNDLYQTSKENVNIVKKLSNLNSSDIRKKIKENKSVLSFTPIEIQEYIKENNLYR
ncbi:MAG: nicotinate (nicotinamide) nucleotide adenylyltransferase [Dehalococcoidia bacterium]|nr:nicotinate (nicotinamide) nucleotide adenylyltransferase [Dehalococcoidia bacterium]|tara:strand:+ start:219 stop:782 length:564 start_codon:yes stop_codon:yes gene_type:complete